MQIQLLSESQLGVSENDITSSMVEVSSLVFDVPYNQALVHQIVVAYQANGRSGSRKQKDRAEVAHSTRKPWRQKGTGRARAGMSSSPLWRGGGRIFPNSPEENFTQKVNRKMFRLGMCSIYSELIRLGRLRAIDQFTLSESKTKVLTTKLKDMGCAKSLMLITSEISDEIYFASRNLAHLAILPPDWVDPVSLLYYDKVLVTEQALKEIEEHLT